MKYAMVAAPTWLSLYVLLIPCVSAELASSGNTISKVVKLLETMMAKSKADGDNERTLYGKYKCYCDTNEADKKDAIAQGTEDISLFENQIEDLRAENAELSKDVAQLKSDMEANQEARKKADDLRAKEKKAFKALEKDLIDSMKSMSLAIKTLADVGADQSLDGFQSAGNAQYMSDYKKKSLLNLKKTVKQALLAASSVVNKRQDQTLQSFLQSPFTGTYSAQSGEVVGILKDMRDTFTSNLATATSTEETAQKAYDAFTEAKVEEYKDMKTSRGTKEEKLSTNDGDLATKTAQLEAAEKKLASDQDFLTKLVDMCAAKAKEYEERTLLRTNEETAIAEAISILNSDAAFATFGTTKKWSFLQFSQINKHGFAPAAQDQRERAKAFLQKAALGKNLPLLSRAIALLQTTNPFAVVLGEIQKMLDLIDKEEKADDDQFAWCKEERKTNNDNLKKKKSEITSLESAINQLDNTINNEKTGLKFKISETEQGIETNLNNQKTQTKDRTEDNLAYQKNIANLVEAQRILTKALKVLKVYYSTILKKEESFVAVSNSQAPPETWEADYAGQKKDGGTDAIGMLEFVLKDTKKEEMEAHGAEKTSQHAFEDDMAKLKKEEQQLRDNQRKLELELTKTVEKLLGKQADLETTVKDKEAIEAYLAKIKDGCDFITDHIADRKQSRLNEAKALSGAVKLLKKSPAYIAAEADKHQQSLGDCAGICNDKSEAHADCKACLAKVTVPAYCAGHPGTAGC